MTKTWRWDMDDDGYFSSPQPIVVPDWYTKEDVAEDAAEKYHSENDGWEDDWPVTFRIYPPDSETFIRIKVDREYDPVFSAYLSLGES